MTAGADHNRLSSVHFAGDAVLVNIINLESEVIAIRLGRDFPGKFNEGRTYDRGYWVDYPSEWVVGGSRGLVTLELSPS